MELLSKIIITIKNVSARLSLYTRRIIFRIIRRVYNDEIMLYKGEMVSSHYLVEVFELCAHELWIVETKLA